MIEADDLRAARIDIECTDTDREGFIRVRRADLLDIIDLVCRQDDALRLAGAGHIRQRFALRLPAAVKAPARRSRR